MSKISVEGLAWDIDDNRLRQKFEEFGEIEEAFIVRDAKTGRSQGLGFVRFSNNDDAVYAAKSMDTQEFDGRKISVTQNDDMDKHEASTKA